MSSPFPIPVSGKKCRLAVIGVGALGSEFCRLLACACQIEVVLIDPDTVESRNLHYSEMLRLHGNSLFGNRDDHGHEFKGNLVVNAAQRIFLQHDWSFFPVEIADINLSIIAACDLILSCTDNALARCETAWIARLLGKGMIDGGLKGEGERAGRVAWYPPDGLHACYLCEIAESRRADILSSAASGSLGCAQPPAEQAMDALPAMVTVLAEQMLDVTRRVLSASAAGVHPRPHRAGASAWFYRMDEEERGGVRVEEVSLTRSATCPWHDTVAEGLRAADTTLPVRELLQQLARSEAAAGSMVLDLHWPICLRARCKVCGAEVRPLRRLGWMRKHGACAQCRAVGALEPVESLQTITEESPAAQWTLGDFGFTPGDLFCFRPEYC